MFQVLIIVPTSCSGTSTGLGIVYHLVEIYESGEAETGQIPGDS